LQCACWRRNALMQVKAATGAMPSPLAVLGGLKCADGNEPPNRIC
jgi:hypothetical protein